MQLPSVMGGAIVEDGQGQQASVWLQSLGLQHLVAPLHLSSLLTMKALSTADVSMVLEIRQFKRTFTTISPNSEKGLISFL